LRKSCNRRGDDDDDYIRIISRLIKHVRCGAVAAAAAAAVAIAAAAADVIVPRHRQNGVDVEKGAQNGTV